jgi:type I restriction enzyme M protein
LDKPQYALRPNISTVPDDKLGDAYKYLIKEFADDSGHTAAEFA